MVWRLIAALILISLSSCAPRTIVRTEIVEVQVPVAVPRTPPDFLLTPPRITLPAFVSPTHPEATSALTAQGERDLKRLLLLLHERNQQWQAWGTAK